MCEGVYSQKWPAKSFTTAENIHFLQRNPDGLHHFMIFADPIERKRGGDSFALVLVAIGPDGNMYLV